MLPNTEKVSMKSPSTIKGNKIEKNLCAECQTVKLKRGRRSWAYKKGGLKRSNRQIDGKKSLHSIQCEQETRGRWKHL